MFRDSAARSRRALEAPTIAYVGVRRDGAQNAARDPDGKEGPHGRRSHYLESQMPAWMMALTVAAFLVFFVAGVLAFRRTGPKDGRVDKTLSAQRKCVVLLMAGGSIQFATLFMPRAANVHEWRDWAPIGLYLVWTVVFALIRPLPVPTAPTIR